MAEQCKAGDKQARTSAAQRRSSLSQRFSNSTDRLTREIRDDQKHPETDSIAQGFRHKQNQSKFSYRCLTVINVTMAASQVNANGGNL